MAGTVPFGVYGILNAARCRVQMNEHAMAARRLWRAHVHWLRSVCAQPYGGHTMLPDLKDRLVDCKSRHEMDVTRIMSTRQSPVGFRNRGMWDSRYGEDRPYSGY